MLADGEEKRCPSCRTRLGNRGRPIVLGESNRISSRPVLPIEFELQAQVVAENQAQDRRRRVATAVGGGPPDSVPPSFGGVGGEAAAIPDRPRHRPRRRRKLAPRSRIDTAPTPPPAFVDADIIEAELVDLDLTEVVEAAVVEPEAIEPVLVVEPEAVEAPEPPAREVVIPEVLFDDEVGAASDQRTDPVPPVSQSHRNLFSASAGSPRVKKIRAQGRKGWVVDYVVPESDDDTET
jgi:hypothetical protein